MTCMSTPLLQRHERSHQLVAGPNPRKLNKFERRSRSHQACKAPGIVIRAEGRRSRVSRCEGIGFKGFVAAGVFNGWVLPGRGLLQITGICKSAWTLACTSTTINPSSPSTNSNPPKPQCQSQKTNLRSDQWQA